MVGEAVGEAVVVVQREEVRDGGEGQGEEMERWRIFCFTKSFEAEVCPFYLHSILVFSLLSILPLLPSSSPLEVFILQALFSLLRALYSIPGFGVQREELESRDILCEQNGHYGEVINGASGRS